MASSYSTNLALELIGTGDQAGSWGITTNNNFGSLVEQAITGVETITMGDATYTLSSYDGAVDEARNAVLVLGGTVTTAQNLIAPTVEKVYIVNNQTGATITIKTASGSGQDILNGTTALVYCDGTNFYSATPSLNSVVGDLTVSGSGAFGNNVTVTHNAAVGGNLSVTGTLSAGSISGLTGRVVQTAFGYTTSGFATNSTSPAPSGFTVSITPTSVSSKILVLFSGPFANPHGAGGIPSGNAWLSIYRNGTNLAGGTNFMADASSDDANMYINCAVNVLDSPASTSTLTYQPYLWSQGDGSLFFGYCSMTLLEIL